jgi:hypothetical protein
VVKEFGRGASGNERIGKHGRGDYTIAFTAAVPLPARLLRNHARYSGTHIYSGEDDVVFADSTMVAVHAVKPGRRIICLPKSCDVHDVITGKLIANQAEVIRFMVKKPVTRWLELKR